MKGVHRIKCLNKDCIGGRIETTMTGDFGYSNYTVMENGELEIKCHGCGKFASTDTFKEPNEMTNFKINCASCGSLDWEYYPQDVDCDREESHIQCKKCGATSFELNNFN